MRRVIAAEVLRRAFRACPTTSASGRDAQHPRATSGESRTGQACREPVRRMAATTRRAPTRSSRASPRTRRSTAADVDALSAMAAQRPRRAIDAAVDESATSARPELSERLANAGVLPMFGFPTRVRTLYRRRPRKAQDEARPSQRSPARHGDLELRAGRRVTKDKQIHVCVGFAAYEVNARGDLRDRPARRADASCCVASTAVRSSSTGPPEGPAATSAAARCCSSTSISRRVPNRLPSARLRRPGRARARPAARRSSLG